MERPGGAHSPLNPRELEARSSRVAGSDLKPHLAASSTQELSHMIVRKYPRLRVLAMAIVSSIAALPVFGAEERYFQPWS